MADQNQSTQSEQDANNAEQAPPQPEPVAVETSDDRVRRLMADFENYRRNSAKDLLQERQRGRREAVQKLLSVYDSVTMALLSMKTPDPSVKAGLEAMAGQFVSAFDSLGLKKVETKGVPFDPAVHEAIAHLPNPTVPEGQILQESRTGFADSIGLLRPAQVVVSSGSGQ